MWLFLLASLQAMTWTENRATFLVPVGGGGVFAVTWAGSWQPHGQSGRALVPNRNPLNRELNLSFELVD
jgi:hypothetical protein